MTEHQDSCMGNNAFFKKGKQDGFRFHCRNTPEMDVALKELLPDPDAAFETAQILKHGSRTHGGIVTFSGKSYYLKRYNDMGFWYRLRHLFKRSRAVRTWNVGWDFYNNNTPVPEPLICLEERRYLFLRRSYILMGLVKEAQSLKTAWQEISDKQKSNILIVLAKALNSMHMSNHTHGDLKWDNILVNISGDDLKVTLVDLDSCSTAYFLSNTMAQKDIKLFLRWLKHHENNKAFLNHLLDLWSQHYPANIKS